jgi:hypothetical protein
MIIGFTGTQQELPAAQERGLELLLGVIHATNAVAEAHHGDCIGADARFDDCCWRLGIERHAHPGPDGARRAHCCADLIYPSLPFLDRNHVIVDASDVLIACPRGTAEELRSGTWATVRYARKSGRKIFFVWPDGHTTTEPARTP